MYFDALLAGIVEHHRVKFAADDLPGLRAFVRLVVVEIKRGRFLALGVDKLDAVFLDERTGLHFVEHFETFEDPISLWNQRLTDMEAREALALEELDFAAVLDQKRGNRAACWAAANDNNIRFFADIHVHEEKTPG